MLPLKIAKFAEESNRLNANIRLVRFCTSSDTSKGNGNDSFDDFATANATQNTSNAIKTPNSIASSSLTAALIIVLINPGTRH